MMRAMRTTIAAVLLSLSLAAPAAARADLALSLPSLGAERAPAGLLSEPTAWARLGSPEPRLVPDLRLDPALDLGGGDGMRRSDRAVLALVLGIIPGFGVGHVVAEVDSWVIWLVVDVVVFAISGIFWFGPGPDWPGALIWVLERVLEGVDAYHRALGRHFLTRAGPPPGAPALARDAALPEPRGLALAR